MIKWFCDFCGKEIVDNKNNNIHYGENPTKVVVYTEGVGRDLNGYEEADYLHIKKPYCCKECLPSIREAIEKAITSQIKI